MTVREVGKPVSEARAEVARGVSILRYYGQLAVLPDTTHMQVTRRADLVLPMLARFLD